MRRSRTVEALLRSAQGWFFTELHFGVVKVFFGAPNKDMGGYMKRLKRVKTLWTTRKS